MNAAAAQMRRLAPRNGAGECEIGTTEHFEML